MFLLPTLLLLGAAIVVRAASEARATPTTGNPHFVSTSNSEFRVNNSAFKFIGTNAYWLTALNSDEDIDATFASIKKANITVVRTWAFNDVLEIPQNGTWFQLLVNGTSTLNLNETTGLPKLDRIISMAEKHGIYLLLSLTNNWNPLPTDNLTDTTHPAIAKRDVLTNNSLPRNSLSNDYGGMDAYVRSFGGKTHDEFYVNETMITAFEHYITQLVSRYVNNASVLAWEVANDPRCTSSLNSTSSCNTTTLTLWHERIATHISSIDPNHLVSSGTQGFLCADCPKVNKQPTTPSPSRPQPSSGSAKRQNVPSPLTRARVLQERKAARKVTRALRLKSEVPSGVRVRGKWVATPTVRQDNSVGSAFDGSTGVDSGDILDIAQIGFGSFQLFPDQNQYAPDDPNLPAFNNTVQAGLQWIRMHSQSSQTANKPIIMSGFGLVTQESAPSFVPFNSTVAPFANDQIGNVTLNPGVAPYGVTDPQRNDAYMQWLQQGIASGLAGIIQYQWGQGNLTTANGTAIAPTITENGIEPVQNSTGVSPSDGYSIVGVGQESVQNVIQQAAQQFAPN